MAWHAYRGPEDNSWESVLFYLVGQEGRTQVIRLGATNLFLLSYLASLDLTFCSLLISVHVGNSKHMVARVNKNKQSEGLWLEEVIPFCLVRLCFLFPQS